MANNRILKGVTFCYGDSEKGIHMLNIGPRTLKLKGGDNVYLVVEMGNTPWLHGKKYSIKITWHDGAASPFDGEIATKCIVGDPLYLGTLNSVTEAQSLDYTIELTFIVDEIKQVYTEDPKMEIDPDT